MKLRLSLLCCCMMIFQWLSAQSDLPIYIVDTAFWKPVHPENHIRSQKSHIQNTEHFKYITNDTYYYSNKREFSVNTTQLLSLFTPFNFGANKFTYYGLITKLYGRRGAFRFAIGGEFDSFTFLSDQIRLSVGYEYRREIFRRFTYISSWSGILHLDNLTTFVGVENMHGIEYNVNQRIALSTETYVQLGINGFGTRISVLPPTALFCTFRF